MVDDFDIKTRARRDSPPPPGASRQRLYQCRVIHFFILRPTSNNLLERTVPTQITHHNYQTSQLRRRPGRESPQIHLHFQHVHYFVKSMGLYIYSMFYLFNEVAIVYIPHIKN